MVYIFIAVFLVLLIMNIIMSFLLKQMAVSTGKQIERDALRLFTVYDELLEAKSQKLVEMQTDIELCQEKLERLDKKAAVPAGAVGAAVAGRATVITGSYQDPGFAENYREIKKTFNPDRAWMTELLKEFLSVGASEEYENLVKIGNKFSSDELYEASTLTREEQEELLTMVLTPGERSLYENYIGQHGLCELSEFIAWADARRKQLDPAVTVMTGDEELARTLADMPGLKLVLDPGICEGFKILQGTRMYDYSI